MSKTTLKRLAAPKTWPIQRKINKWITRPNPGPHSLDSSISINTIFKELLKITKTTIETKRLLNEGKILINNTPRKDYKFPLGLFDVISLPNDKYYRLLFNKKGGFILFQIKKEEATTIPYKILNKTPIKNKIIQLNLHNGKNINIKENNYKVNDTLLLDEKNNIKEHFKFEKGSLIYIIKGNHVSSIGVLEGISKENRIIFKTDKQKFITLKDYAFVIGKDKPVISSPK